MFHNQRVWQVRRTLQHGQSAVELAIIFPVLVLVLVVLVQFTLFVHARNVITGAVQDGAHVAAMEDRSLEDGVNHTNALLGAALGQSATTSVRGGQDRWVVVIEAQGELQMIIPLPGIRTLPLHARAIQSKEQFRAGPGR